MKTKTTTKTDYIGTICDGLIPLPVSQKVCNVIETHLYRASTVSTVGSSNLDWNRDYLIIVNYVDFTSEVNEYIETVNQKQLEKCVVKIIAEMTSSKLYEEESSCCEGFSIKIIDLRNGRVTVPIVKSVSFKTFKR